MQISSEDTLFQNGIQALQAGKPLEARANFQSAIDGGIATARTWLGLALSHIFDNDLEGAEAAIDQTLKLAPHNLQALVYKGDILFERNQSQAAAAHYGRALQLAAGLPEIPPALQRDLQRIAGRQRQLAQSFEEHLMSNLRAAGYRRESASDRFNLSLDMLMGRKQRHPDGRTYPQAPNVYYMPDVPYHQFFPREALPWLEKLEAATDAIESELNAVLQAHSDRFKPYVHSGIDQPQGSDAGLMDSDDWTSAYLWKDGVPDEEVIAHCPTTVALMEELPLCQINGFLPSVLFSKLKPGAKIAPHTGMLNTRLICHLPLTVPAGCGLRVGDDSRDTVRGEAWAFDDSINHEAWNSSGEDRVILLFDVWRPELDPDECVMVKALLEAVTGLRDAARIN